jgi:hypothetical protein
MGMFLMRANAEGTTDRVKSALHDDALSTAVVAGATTFGTGAAGALMSGGWQVALLALCGLAALTLATVLFSAGWWHFKERGENDFGRAQDQEAERRNLKDYERDFRALITNAVGRTQNADGMRAEISALLEMLRKHISSAHPSFLGLLLLHDCHPSEPRVIAQAGSFEQALLDDAHRLNDWIDSSKGCVYPGRVEVAGEYYRLLGVADSAFGEYAQAEVQRAATNIQALMVAHMAAGAAASVAG